MPLNSTAVALTSCSGYEQHQLAQALARALEATTLPANLCSAQVLLKPNLISAKHGPLACTEGAFILAVARWFLDQGAKVSIGDSPAFGTAAAVLHRLGLVDELAALGVAIINFTRGRATKLSGGGRAVLAEAALDCDLLVNLPRVKVHAQARLTLAVKNYFGCLVGLHKGWWHMAYGDKADQGSNQFFDRLLRIPQALPDSVTLMDGIVAMHRTGPVNGEPYPLSLLAASTNPVAMDTALHAILRADPEQSPLMAACRRAGMSGAHLAQLSFPLAAPEEFQAAGFLVPEQLNPVRFRVVRFLKSSIRRIVLHRQAGR